MECIGRSYRNNPVGVQQLSSQFLPEVVGKTTKSAKSGSVVRTALHKKDEEILGSNPTYETLSDERISCALSSSEKESKDYQSSSHSRRNKAVRKANSLYGDGTIEYLRSLSKAEKELRGIFSFK